MPLPLYGSGFFTARIWAANWPTFSASMPDTLMPVLSETTFMPSGIASVTRWEKPTARTKSLPLTSALKPIPSIMSFFSYTLVTPASIFFICDAYEPHMAIFGISSRAGAIVIVLSATIMEMSWLNDFFISPRRPLTDKTSPENDAVVFAGMTMGFFAMRDMIV